jgi:hypothetical protein
VILIVTEYLISVPKTASTIKTAVKTFENSGWKLLSVEKLVPEYIGNIKYTVGWPENKGEPVYPPNVPRKAR